MVFFICLAQESFEMPTTVLGEEQVVAGLGVIVVDLATIMRNNPVEKEVQTVLINFKIVKEVLLSKLAGTEHVFHHPVETLGHDSGAEDTVRSAAFAEVRTKGGCCEEGGCQDPWKGSMCARRQVSVWP